MGAVIRDSSGKVVAAGIQQTLLRGNVSLVEAEAVQWGMQVARKACISSLIIESDCLEVVELQTTLRAADQKSSRQFHKFSIKKTTFGM